MHNQLAANKIEEKKEVLTGVGFIWTQDPTWNSPHMSEETMKSNMTSYRVHVLHERVVTIVKLRTKIATKTSLQCCQVCVVKGIESNRKTGKIVDSDLPLRKHNDTVEPCFDQVIWYGNEPSRLFES